MANLVVDIGNTVLKAAWTDGLTLGKTFRYQGERMTDFILSLTARQKPEVLVIASASDISSSSERMLSKECSRLVLLDPSHKAAYEGSGIPDYISPDRFASLKAAAYLFRGRACTVIDFGTTISVDFTDNLGNYLGGNISPGCRTRFRALNRYAGNLPLLDTPEETGEIGTSLISSIESGVVRGIMFEIGGYLDSYPDNIVVFTGGDAIYFAKRIKNSIFAVCNLVLMGLAIIACSYVK